jgi:hypothetical protein
MHLCACCIQNVYVYLQANREIVMAAVLQNPEALQHAAPELQADADFMQKVHTNQQILAAYKVCRDRLRDRAFTL